MGELTFSVSLTTAMLLSAVLTVMSNSAQCQILSVKSVTYTHGSFILSNEWLADGC